MSRRSIITDILIYNHDQASKVHFIQNPHTDAVKLEFQKLVNVAIWYWLRRGGGMALAAVGLWLSYDGL